MAIRVSENGSSEVTLTMDKSFDFNCVEEFRTAYEGIDSTPKEYVIDLRHTHYMDSSALGMLINMHKYCTERGSKISISNTNPQIKKIFAISRFDKKFNIA